MIATMAFSTVGFFSFLFTLPLLMLHKRGLSTGKCLWVQGVSYLGVMVYTVYPYIGFFSPENMGIILFGTVFTLISALEALIYTAMDFRSNSVLRKLVVASIPAFVIGGGYAAWITSPMAAVSFDGFRASVASILENTMPSILQSINPEMLVGMMLMLMVPMAMLLGGIPVVIAEFALNCKDEQWQNDMAYMKLPAKYSVLLLVCVVLFVPAFFITSYPRVLGVIGWNCGLGLLMHFTVNGASIFLAMRRRSNPSFSAGRVIWLFILAGFLPGINLGLCVAFSVLAVLENWVKFR